VRGREGVISHTHPATPALMVGVGVVVVHNEQGHAGVREPRTQHCTWVSEKKDIHVSDHGSDLQQNNP